MSEQITQGLRDVILLEIDFLNTHAEQLDLWRRNTVAASSPFLTNALNVTSASIRGRVTILKSALTASQPEANAS